MNRGAWLTEDVKVRPTENYFYFWSLLKVYISFVVILILAGGIVLTKICVYDWWWRGQVWRVWSSSMFT